MGGTTSSFPDAQRVAGLLRDALEQVSKGETGRTRTYASYYVRLALHLCDASMRPPPRGRGSLAPWQSRLAREMVLAALDRPLMTTAVACACRMTKAQFVRAFTSTFGESPVQWRNRQRIARAELLLRESTMSLAAVGTACGFRAQANFSRSFKAQTGMAPSVYRACFAQQPTRPVHGAQAP